jgi:hypothetical protein
MGLRLPNLAILCLRLITLSELSGVGLMIKIFPPLCKRRMLTIYFMKVNNLNIEQLDIKQFESCLPKLVNSQNIKDIQ